MGVLDFLNRDAPRNVTEEKLDTSGRFRLIEHYDSDGKCQQPALPGELSGRKKKTRAAERHPECGDAAAANLQCSSPGSER